MIKCDRNFVVLSMKLLLILLVVCGSFVNAISQQSDTVLVDEFGLYPCDGFRGRIDGFFAELTENPGWDGVVVNIGQGRSELSAIVREEMIRSHAAFRGYDLTRIHYSRSTDAEFATRFLRAPSAERSRYQAAKNYALHSIVEPLVLEDYDFDALCPPIDYSDLFATILADNPNSRAVVLFRGKTLKQARRKMREVSAFMASRKIASNRLKFLLTEKPDFNFGTDPVVEFRYIP